MISFTLTECLYAFYISRKWADAMSIEELNGLIVFHHISV